MGAAEEAAAHYQPIAGNQSGPTGRDDPDAAGEFIKPVNYEC